ncbi:MAG: pilus assembly protein PilM [Bacillota bacterium]
MAKQKTNKTKRPQRVLALDIGTRSIVGILLEKSDEIVVQAVEYLEHEARSMYDGQIHDVEAVAAEIAVIKDRLQKSTGLKLKQAAVAAAGRALRTVTGIATASRSHMLEITWEEIKALELEAVQKAQRKIAGDDKALQDHFCVGYSVVNYTLDDQVLQNLVGQTGHKIEVEIIATFLPRVVVDSLFSALRKAGMEVGSLTLEPIAALTAAIPPHMRLLNLALVDIGAGTSDIAVVQKEKIVAYAMVPVGGDEITESLAEQYLLDFNTAEKVKRQLCDKETLTFVDVLENRITETAAVIIERIKPVIRDLATSIAREILMVNQKAPDAVVCVGGGSLTPGLLKDLANALELPPNRVGIRTRETLDGVKGEHPALTGPQAVTPIGIGLNAMTSRPLPLVKVKINNHEIPLWGLQEITVSTALLASGFSLNNLYGRPGMGLTVEVNGVLRTFKGSLGTPSTIKVNGITAAFNTHVQAGDHVEFVPGKDGEDATILVKDLVDNTQGTIFVNGEPVTVSPKVYVNGQLKGWDETVPDRAKVEVITGQPVKELLAKAGVDQETLSGKTFRFSVNDRDVTQEWSPCRVRLNGERVDLDSLAEFGDHIDFSMQDTPTLREVLDINDTQTSVELIVNNQPLVLQRGGILLQMNGNTVSLDHPLEDGAVLKVKPQAVSTIVSDLLTQITVTPKPSGNLVIKVNGVEAGFTTPVKSGDRVDLYWQDIE